MGRVVSVWSVLVLAMAGPVVIAATSPWLAGRDTVYIVAGFAGIGALALCLIQPLLAGGYLPAPRPALAKRWHRWIGSGIVAGIGVHVGGLYLTSPQDTLDALFLVSPTPFSVYGVVGLGAAVLTVVLVLLRTWLKWRPGMWRGVHNALAAVIVVASIVHALKIEGTMGVLSKWGLYALILAATIGTIVHLRIIKPMRRR